MSVTWSGTTVEGPVLLYHDEIPRSVGSNGLLCQTSENTGVAWHLTEGTTVRTTGFTHVGGFYQTISSTRVYLLHSLGFDPSSANHNGLWSCRLNGDAGSAIPVGLYQRGCEYNLFDQIMTSALIE